MEAVRISDDLGWWGELPLELKNEIDHSSSELNEGKRIPRSKVEEVFAGLKGFR